MCVCVVSYNKRKKTTNWMDGVNGWMFLLLRDFSFSFFLFFLFSKSYIIAVHGKYRRGNGEWGMENERVKDV